MTRAARASVGGSAPPLPPGEGPGVRAFEAHTWLIPQTPSPGARCAPTSPGGRGKRGAAHGTGGNGHSGGNFPSPSGKGARGEGVRDSHMAHSADALTRRALRAGLFRGERQAWGCSWNRREWALRRQFPSPSGRGARGEGVRDSHMAHSADALTRRALRAGLSRGGRGKLGDAHGTGGNGQSGASFPSPSGRGARG
ncbi:hypothetical protein SAMN04488068_1314, partial [Hydrocarboniphaga daqingensis]